MNLQMQLQRVAGPIATALAAISRYCVGQSSEVERQASVSELLRLVPTRADAQALLEAHGTTVWSGTYGESPYEHAAGLLRHALSGVALPPRSSNAERDMHESMLCAYALPTAVMRWELDRELLTARYPRLLRAMQLGALLTTREAQGAVYILLHTHPLARHRSCPSSEAVDHFGGNVAAVRSARRWRARFGRPVKRQGLAP